MGTHPPRPPSPAGRPSRRPPPHPRPARPRGRRPLRRPHRHLPGAISPTTLRPGTCLLGSQTVKTPPTSASPTRASTPPEGSPAARARLQSMGRLRLRGRRHRTCRHPRHRPLRRRFGSSGNAGAPPLVRPGRDSPAVARATTLPVKSRPGPGRPVVRRHQNRRVPGPGAPGRDGCGGRCPPGRRREVWEAREIPRLSLVQWCLE